MTDQLISFGTAKLAKEKGFNIHICRCGGFPDCVCVDLLPTQSLLQKWLREEYNTHIIIEPDIDPLDNTIYYRWRVRINMQPAQVGMVAETYEEALEQGLIEALKLIP